VRATPAPRTLLAPQVVCIATAMAVVGMSQYWPNFVAVSNALYASPQGWTERLARILVRHDQGPTGVRSHGASASAPARAAIALRMWWFDLRQQFGRWRRRRVLACAGLWQLWRSNRLWAMVISLALAITTTFAFTYNVGDTHVFFLPSHFLTALCAGAECCAFDRIAPRQAPRRGRHRLRSVARVVNVARRGSP
jgi:hypothetical protein